MAYKQGYTNAKDVLADFITTVCFDDRATSNFETWQLIYPLVATKEEAKEWILNNRRATISSTFVPKNQWQQDEVIRVNQKYLDKFSEFFVENIQVNKKFLDKYSNMIEIKLERLPIDLNAIKVNLYDNDTSSVIQELSYNPNEESLSINEFCTQGKKDILILKSSIPATEDNKISIKIEYEIKPTFDLPLSEIIFDQEAVKVSIKGHKGVFYNNKDIDSLNTMEFYADVENQKIILLKDTIKLSENEEFIFLISYQTYAVNPVTWYVDFQYPEFTMDSEKNYNYFEWTFSNEIDEETYHVINKKGKAPILKCFWHTVNKLKTPAADWLPIEYFISWDDSAISFVMCEDPITDMSSVIHAFNYIGSLESIKNADYDDIKGNFGSCGSYDITIKSSEGNVKKPDKAKMTANISFIKKHYNGYFEPKGSEENLLKLNNVAYGNFTCDSSNSDGENLLQSETQQYIVGDEARDSSLSQIKTVSPINTPTSLYNILKNKSISTFILQKGTKIAKDGEDIELELDKETKVNFLNEFYATLPSNNTEISLVKDTVVHNTLQNINETLQIGTQIVLSNSLNILCSENSPFNVPAGIDFTLVDGTKYKTISITPVIVTNIILMSDTKFKLKNDTIIYRPDADLVITQDTLPAGTNIKLLKDYVDCKFSLLQNYTVEFQYRDPYLGNMYYDFPSEWFNGTKSKVFTDFSGQSPIITPIIEEKLTENSKFANESEIKDKYTESARGKSNVTGRLAFDIANANNYHKNKVVAPDIITNTTSGESWHLLEVQASPGIEKTNNSITNICMYPRQIYIGNLCYKKRTLNKCTVTLGQYDISRMRLALIDKNNKVLVDFNGSNTYKNLTIVRNSDNGVTITVDFDNLVDEKVYLAMYKLNNYYNYGHYNYYFYSYHMLIDLLFNYSSSYSEHITTITNRTYFSGYNPNMDPFTSIAINTTATPNKDFIVPNTFRYLTIDLNSTNKTFIPNMGTLTNMYNNWM